MEAATTAPAATAATSKAPFSGAPRSSGNGSSDAPRTLSVASQSNVKSLAGSISHTSRASDPPVLQAVGASSLNQAIKAIAVARSFLENDDIDLEVEVSRVPDEAIRNLLQLKLVKKPRSETASALEGDFVDLRCAATTETASLGGAIAKNIREKARVRVTAIGPNPIFRAVDAMVKTRSFLEKDSLDICFIPMFTTIANDKGSVNAMQFLIVSK